MLPNNQAYRNIAIVSTGGHHHQIRMETQRARRRRLLTKETRGRTNGWKSITIHIPYFDHLIVARTEYTECMSASIMTACLKQDLPCNHTTMIMYR